MHGCHPHAKRKKNRTLTKKKGGTDGRHSMDVNGRKDTKGWGVVTPHVGIPSN